MKEKIIIGQIGLSFHKVAAGVFHRLLDYWGYPVEIVTDVHEKIFEQQQNSAIDLLISAWLPGSHDKYLQPYQNEVIKFTPIYQPYCIWGVPAYIPKSELATVEDLNNAALLAKMDKTINGIGMGAGISRFSVEMLKAYQLSGNGYHFISNDFEVFCRLVEQNIAAQKWFIIPLWQPQYLHTMFDIRALTEAKGLLRGQDQATPILLKKSAHKIAAEHLHLLSKITLGNELINRMDYSFNKEAKSAFQVAEEYMYRQFGSIENYLASLA